MITPRDYLTNALELLERHALHRDRVDWSRVRRQALAEIQGATCPAATYGAIRQAIEALHSPHTLLIPPQAAAEAFGDAGGGTGEPVPEGRIVDGRFGYLTIPEAAAGRQADERYLRVGASLLRSLDAHRPVGWIVDLRRNGGGDMYPMLTVLAPLLGEGVLGSFLDAAGHRSEWVLHGGAVSVAGVVQSPVPHPYRLSDAGAPIAVLIGEHTCSSGEATLVAFLGMPNVRTFGAPTAGRATANTAFDLGDGALLLLTVGYDVDRTGQVYGDEPIPPDEAVPGSDQDVVDAAVLWLRSR